MKTFKASLVGILLAASSSAYAIPAVTNGNFTGGTTGWQILTAAGSPLADRTVEFFGGANGNARLRTVGTANPALHNFSQIESFGGLTGSQVSAIVGADNALRGESIRQTVTSGTFLAGQAVRFDYFVGTDVPNNNATNTSAGGGDPRDVAFVFVTGAGQQLFSTIPSGSGTTQLVFTGGGTLSAGNAMRIGFGVINTVDNTVRMTLQVDNVSFFTNGVPELNAAFAVVPLFMLGLTFLMITDRKSRHQLL